MDSRNSTPRVALYARVSMTVDVYGHLVPGANRAAMDRLPTVEDPVEEAARKLTK